MFIKFTWFACMYNGHQCPLLHHWPQLHQWPAMHQWTLVHFFLWRCLLFTKGWGLVCEESSFLSEEKRITARIYCIHAVGWKRKKNLRAILHQQAATQRCGRSFGQRSSMKWPNDDYLQKLLKSLYALQQDCWRWHANCKVCRTISGNCSQAQAKQNICLMLIIETILSTHCTKGRSFCRGFEAIEDGLP